jgi:hypothetical protein
MDLGVPYAWTTPNGIKGVFNQQGLRIEPAGNCHTLSYNHATTDG